ncbi:MAG: hypothetical protein GY917_26340 [Planctomycetaceae bacterium]|nr:hypothetical protein [Planctomycetaceae bacterium]MCP4812678.1 hypothetical protein [Planctomycetaceae bacterium]
MKKIALTWFLSLVAILTLLAIHRIAYELISHPDPESISNRIRLLPSLLFKILSNVLLISCLLTSFFLPGLQLFLLRKEMKQQVLVAIFLGSLLGPLSILTVVTMIVHDLDGGLLLFLGIISAPVIAIFTLGILHLTSKPLHPRPTKIS